MSKTYEPHQVTAERRLFIFRDSLKADPIEGGLHDVVFIKAKACIHNKKVGGHSRINDLKLVRITGYNFTYSLVYFGSKVYFTTDYNAGL
jgi:hypothetical protein